MAIDSKLKRQSIAAIGLYAIGVSVVPSGAFGQAQRQVVGYGYAGILVSGPSVEIDIPVCRVIKAPIMDRLIKAPVMDRIIKRRCD